ncbi:BON domain-containing protein [Candidatus Poribacteria bacterium]|nr:BON domain-containing protein [Candidatus Poribacteria bacterium]
MRTYMTKSFLMISIIIIIKLAVPGSLLSVENDLEDKQITGAVEAKLWIDEGVSSHLIDVETEDGVVTLSGSVDNILSKDRSVDIASSVKGVTFVIDEMEVMDTGRADNEIRNDVINALMFDPATDSFELNVEVEDGTVILSGVVESYAEKTLSATVAKGVKGVRDIENNITVDYKTDRADEEIKSDIEQQINYDVLIEEPINVQVSDGHVELKGTIGSMYEKNAVEDNAWVSGVKSVDTDGLEINWWMQDEAWLKDKYEKMQESDTKNAVELALYNNPRTYLMPIDVELSENVVTLRGVVNNLKAKRVAEDVAEDVEGVWRVKNHIRVRTKRDLTDSGIRDSILSALKRDPYVSRHNINVSVKNEKAYLKGSVDSYFEKDRAEEVTSGVLGVADISNNLSVSYDYSIFSKSDWEIKEDVESQLFWSPFVDSDDIDVSVENGIATLSGSVSNVFEFKSAIKNAKDGGARKVVEDLYIEYGPGLKDVGYELQER